MVTPTRRTKAAKTKTRSKRKAAAKAKPDEPSNDTFDRGAYEVPVLDLAEAIALASALLRVKPSRPSAAIAEEAQRLGAACARAKRVHAGERARGTTVDARSFDVAMDRAWAVFVRRIQDHAELAAVRKQPSIAPRVYGIVHDLSILQLNYLAEFAQIGARLDSLKREGLLDDARDLAGSVFLDEVLRCHAEYGEAIGAHESGDDALRRGTARLALVEALREYTYQVLALARPGRPETWSPVQSALAPLAELCARDEAARAATPAPHRPQPHPPVERALA